MSAETYVMGNKLSRTEAIEAVRAGAKVYITGEPTVVVQVLPYQPGTKRAYMVDPGDGSHYSSATKALEVAARAVGGPTGEQ